MNTMKVTHIIDDNAAKKGTKDHEINALSWQYAVSVAGDEILCIGNVHGVIKIIDAKKNKILTKFELTKQSTIYDIDWGIYGIAVATDNGFV